MEFILFCLKCAGLLICAWIGLHLIVWTFTLIFLLINWLLTLIRGNDEE